MNCCNEWGECTRGCDCPARATELNSPGRRPMSARVDKLITAGLYAVSLAALICAVMVVAVAIGGAI